jgi:16S rRNA C967 or C1407 C5-methylase (RsmB/RsmF family)/NOL1/NOP2/fmu family ribosome biogenesis protein
MHRDQLLAHIASASGVLDASGQQAFVAAHDAPAPVSIRINSAKWSGTSPLRSVPWASHAYYTDGRPSFTFDPLFHAGAYYVQEASSMFLEQAVKACGLANADIIALDLCAAPGGKSTHLLSILGDDALLVSNEVVRPRAKILCDNITKWGRPNVCVTGSDTTLFAGLPEFFDLVVVDAPCSGEGLFRKDADAMSHWSEEAVQQCAIRQSGILEHAWATLRPGGHLIYSTCTYNRSENEQQVQRMVEWGGTCIPIPAQWGVTEVKEGNVVAYRFMPHRTEGEGFFLAALRKSGEGEAFRPSAGRTAWKTVNEPSISAWVANDRFAHLELVANKEAICAITPKMRELLPIITREVYPLQYGVEVASVQKGSLVPSHALAASLIVAKDAFPQIETTLAEAIHYLRGNPLQGSDARGWGMVTYKGHVLGLAKGAGNRWNNHYPTPLRIRDMRTAVADVVLADLG